MNKIILAIPFLMISSFFNPILTATAAEHTLNPRSSWTGADKAKSIAKTAKRTMASWYGPKFHGKKTASGQRFDMYAMTAAHKTLPLLSYAKVTNPENEHSVIVRINDRGPFHGNRGLDLSYAAAKKLGITGVGEVVIKPLGREQALSLLSDGYNSDQGG
ncbi:MAG: septal ring lytic transglycosylase RlpA family protein [Gammaproteobacteria bacterium]